MSKELCESINTIDKYFDDDLNNPEEHDFRNTLNIFFTDSNCSSGEEKISSGFIALLTLLNSIENNDHLKGDQLVEYAILWLSYKLNQKKENGTTKLSDFLTENIKKNSCYDKHIATNTNNGDKIYMDVIDDKINSMDIDIKDISNFYDAFKSLCNMYSELDPEKTQCKKCFENAGEFFEKCEKVKNAFDINKGSSYLQLWSSLSNDYILFKQLYNVNTCANESPFVACPRSSVTKNTIITIAIIFVAASILLGVSYKYSLFGFRKRSQKQHLREMLKK
ncbi:PIR protein [Plasmodium yoelii]|uniref:Yir3 protein n=3 Tax=Plasmodium yoelii TaxID=5861 RepID=Q7RJU1_PLAYO|nr:PIR protein [Plasmodium yoelii]EAA22706.1 putative yir3 protein [Plasmodium yoelii yoelii]WBY58356.1 PIR protein [Plasmodium yoelii yoelii]CDS44411.1 YIR protein [Plasmodium yoelii]VTZ79272.1 PIR protein [Plasmodium yoelii]|eukprot:XP_034493551.1 PIR protein [Plasmodium yoelii]